jgi:hypothetical protein
MFVHGITYFGQWLILVLVERGENASMEKLNSVVKEQGKPFAITHHSSDCLRSTASHSGRKQPEFECRITIFY